MFLPGASQQGGASEDDEKILSDAPMQQEKLTGNEARKMILRELLDTENTYVHGLETCIQSFLVPCRTTKRMMLPQKTVDTLFGNIEEVYKYNRRFLKLLEATVESDDPNATVGDLFDTFFSGYTKTIYARYMCNCDTAINTVLSLTDDNPEFKEFDLETKKAVGLGLQSYLIMPVQRLPRYILLLNELVKHTEESHPDWELLHNALKRSKELTDEINIIKRETEEKQTIADLKTKLDSLPTYFVQTWDSRRLVKHGTIIEESSRQRSLILIVFNDYILVGKEKGHRISVLKLLPILGFRVEKGKDEIGKSFFHITSDDISYTFVTVNSFDRDEWLTALTTTQEAMTKEQRKA